MPRFTELTADAIKQLQSQGLDPSGNDWIMDSETGEIWDRDKAPGMGIGQVGEAIKAFAPGAVETAMTPVKAAGSIADLIRRGTGEYDPNDPSALTSLAKAAEKKTQEMVGEPDVRAHWLAQGIGRGAGQLATLVGGSGLAGLKYGPKALEGISGIVGGIGGLMNAQSTLDRELERQDKAGVNRPGLAAGKAATAGTVGALTDWLLGPGRLIRAAGSPTTLGGAVGRAGINALSGGATEGTQQLTEDLLVTGKPDLAREAQAAAVGAIVQPAGGLAIDIPLRDTTPKVAETAKVETVDDSGPMKLGKREVGQNAGVDVSNPEMPAIMAAVRTGTEWKPANATAVDNVINTIIKNEIPATEEDIAGLFTLQNDETALQKRVRELYVKGVEQAASKPKSFVEQVAGELEVSDKYNKVRKSLEDKITTAGRELDNLAKELEKNPGLGNQAIFQTKQKAHQQQVAVHQEQLTELNRQEAAELEQLRKVASVEGMTERPQELGLPVVADKSGVRVGPGQGPTFQGDRTPLIIQGQVIDINGNLLPEYGTTSADPSRTLLPGIGETDMPDPRVHGPAIPVAQDLPGDPAVVAAARTAIENSTKLLDELANKRAGIEAAVRSGGQVSRTLAGSLPSIDKLIAEEQNKIAEQKKILGRSRKEVDAFMRGETLPGMEGEQGLPFGESQTKYSTIVPPNVDKALRGFAEEIFPSLRGVHSYDPLYLMSRGTTSRMAARNPTGALIKYKFDTYLETGRDARDTQQFNMLLPAEKFAKSERGTDWLRKARASKSWDMTGLTPEEQIGAKAIKDYMEFTREYANEKGVYVHEINDDGTMTYRPGKMVPGYTPTTPGHQVYEAAMEGGDKWQSLKKDFMDAWKKRFGPNSEAMANAALDKMFPTLGSKTRSGEPLFSPVILPKGMDLPNSWIGESAWNDLIRYAKRYSQHMAWAEFIQNTPDGRAAFGLTEDAMGRKDKKPILWTDVPDAWRGAVREGRKSYAEWARNADPNKPPAEPIEPFRDAKLTDAMMMGYRQGSADDPMMQSLNQLSSATILGIPAGLRDASMGATTAAQYGTVGQAVRSTLDYVTGGRKGQQQAARRAGAMGPDVLAPEAVEDGNRIARGIQNTARKFRTVLGREELDLFGKSLMFDVISNLPAEKQNKLIAEFGPTEKMSREEALDYTAARLVRRASNTSSASNISPGMLPQSGDWKSRYFGLMRWSLGQYNNFKEDVVRPIFQEKSKEAMGRFLKLTIGSAVTSSLLNSLLNELFDRKPDNATWGEFLNIARDPDIPLETKIDEFAYTTLANMQLAGAYGWAGDLALAGVRAKAGGRSMSDPLDAQYPLLILGASWGKTLGSYVRAVKEGRAGIADFGQLMQELMGASQNGRIINRLMEVSGLDDKEIKKPVRDSEMVRRVFEVDPKSGRPELVDRNPTDVQQDPFSAGKQALRIPENEYKDRMGGYLDRYLRSRGQPLSLNRWKQGRDYYGLLGRIQGKEEAKKAEEEAAVLDEIVREKNRALRDASR